MTICADLSTLEQLLTGQLELLFQPPIAGPGESVGLAVTVSVAAAGILREAQEPGSGVAMMTSVTIQHGLSDICNDSSLNTFGDESLFFSLRNLLTREEIDARFRSLLT